MEEEEVWRPITGYEGLYEVSNMGRVKQLEANIQSRNMNQVYYHLEEKILQPSQFPYYRVSLFDKYKRRKSYLIHRLVAEHFCINVDKEHRKWVDHINGNKQDNRACNLRWVTIGENNRNHYPYNIDIPWFYNEN